MIDPDLALRDPAENWIKTKIGSLAKADIAGWCQSSITLGEFFQNVNVADESFQVRDIRRITKYQRTAETGPEQWVVYRRSPSDAPYDVIRSRPGRARPDLKLLKLADSTVVKLGDVEELLLSKTISTVASCK